MAVFRIEKTRDYTVMANHHLRNTALSLKAKGLLSLMLSLPEDWDYTTKGLARICRDGVDSISLFVYNINLEVFGWPYIIIIKVSIGRMNRVWNISLALKLLNSGVFLKGGYKNCAKMDVFQVL